MQRKFIEVDTNRIESIKLVRDSMPEDMDLDIVLAHLTFETNETIHDFYSKTQSLVNKYKLQYRNHNAIPFGKIVLRFTKELMRAPEYVPYIVDEYRTIIREQKEYYMQHQYDIEEYPPYTIEEIYETLIEVQAPEKPTRLNISTLQRHQEAVKALTSSRQDQSNKSLILSVFAAHEDIPQLQPVIASFASATPPTDCCTPSICAF